MTEPRDRKCPCCTQLLTESEYIRAMSLLAAASATHALGYEWCRTCGGPVEKGREVHDRPTCFRCLPPPSVEGFTPPPDPPVYATLDDRADWERRLALRSRAKVIPFTETPTRREPVVPQWAGMDDFPGSDFPDPTE